MTIRDYKKRSFLFTFIMGIAAVVFAIGSYVIGINVEYWVLIGIATYGSAMLFGSLIMYIRYRRHPDVADSDERTQRLGGVAMLYTWLMSMLFIFILLALNYMDIVKMTAFVALFISLAFMFITGWGLTFSILV